jgi:Holliday junction resolvasome RuvABC endonuclease subunit
VIHILALDPAAITGWAVLETPETDRRDERVVASDVFKPKGRTMAKRLVSAFEWCRGMISSHHADVLVIEIPYLATYHDRQGRERHNVESFRQQCRLDGVYILAAGELEVEVVEVIPAQRLTALGLPGNLCREAAKAQTLLCVNAIYGLDLDDHNAADAVAVGVAAARMLREKAIVSEGR